MIMQFGYPKLRIKARDLKDIVRLDQRLREAAGSPDYNYRVVRTKGFKIIKEIIIRSQEV